MCLHAGSNLLLHGFADSLTQVGYLCRFCLRSVLFIMCYEMGKVLRRWSLML